MSTLAMYILNRVQKFTNDGTYVTQWGTTGKGDGQFTGASGLTVDSEGRILVVDSGYDTDADNGLYVVRVQKFAADGTYLSQFGRFGVLQNELLPSWGVVTDDDGNVYVADQDLNTGMRPSKDLRLECTNHTECPA